MSLKSKKKYIYIDGFKFFISSNSTAKEKSSQNLFLQVTKKSEDESEATNTECVEKLVFLPPKPQFFALDLVRAHRHRHQEKDSYLAATCRSEL